MNAFTTTAATFLSRYADSLLKEQCEEALSGRVLGDTVVSAGLIESAIVLMKSFSDDDYMICGLHRTNGSIAQQQKLAKMLDVGSGPKLKAGLFAGLSAEDRAGTLRLLLRRLPESIYPQCQRAVIADIAASVHSGRLRPENALKTLQILTYFVPTQAKACLKELIGHFQLIVANSAINRMGVENVALVFASIVFPISQDQRCPEVIKAEVERACRLFPILICNAGELFHLPDDFIDTLESSVQKHVDEHRAWECSSPVLKEDPELVMSETASSRMTPTQSTTNLELAKLMATISGMPDGSAKSHLIRRLRHSQRRRLGIAKKPSLFANWVGARLRKCAMTPGVTTKNAAMGPGADVRLIASTDLSMYEGSRMNLIKIVTGFGYGNVDAYSRFSMQLAVHRLSGRARILAAALLVYVLAYFLFTRFADQVWLPSRPRFDATLLNKRPDGPLIVRDEVAEPLSKGTLVLSKSLISAVKFDGPVKYISEDDTAFQPPSLQLIKKFKTAAKKVNNGLKSQRSGNFSAFVLFTLINDAYVDFTLNWLCNVHALGHGRANHTDIHAAVLIVGMGKKVCTRLRHDWPKLNCFDYDEQPMLSRLEGQLAWGRQRYLQLLAVRSYFLAALAEERIPFVLFEADSIWLRDPRAELFAVQGQIEDADLVVPLTYRTHQSDRFVFSPMLVFPTDTAKRALQELRRNLSRSPATVDQTILNQLCSAQYMGLVCREFAWDEVADGKWFKMSDAERRRGKSASPYIVHNNLYTGIQNKVSRQTLASLWFISAKSRMCNTAKTARMLAKFTKF